MSGQKDNINFKLNFLSYNVIITTKEINSVGSVIGLIINTIYYIFNIFRY